MTDPTPEERANRLLHEGRDGEGRNCWPGTILISREIRAAVEAERERCAKIAEERHDFGPSTGCPDCGSDGQVFRWYMLGRTDAAVDIRKLSVAKEA